jgi:hypothetical protein
MASLLPHQNQSIFHLHHVKFLRMLTSIAPLDPRVRGRGAGGEPGGRGRLFSTPSVYSSPPPRIALFFPNDRQAHLGAMVRRWQP